MKQPSPWLTARSNIAGVEFPALAAGSTASLAALVRQLDDTQWLSAAEIERRQFAQLRHLTRHAAQFSAHFRKRLAQVKLRPEELTSPEMLRKLPVLRRRDLQTGQGVTCSEVPANHQPVGESKTSGSTGEPVAVKRTAISQLIWLAMTMREHFWIGSDFAAPLAAVRANVTQVSRDQDWGAPSSLLFRTGPALRLPITLSVEQLTAQLIEFKPANLIVYPNTLDAMARHCAAQGIAFGGLQIIRTIGETLNATVRERAESTFSARVVDGYSSQELGNIALQCPHSDLYHVMAESLIVEIIDDAGNACKIGQVGRVVATDLHNFATPLIRYDIGDYAEVAAPCSCGRGLPALKRIIGRERNLIVMPDGTRHWPLVGFHRFRDVAPVIQYQLIQQTRETIEIRLVVETPLTPAQEDSLRGIVQEALGHPFALHFVYFDNALPRAANGKFDEFVSNADASTTMPGTPKPQAS